MSVYWALHPATTTDMVWTNTGYISCFPLVSEGRNFHVYFIELRNVAETVSWFALLCREYKTSGNIVEPVYIPGSS